MHFSRILVTTDFSDDSYKAFDLAAYNRKMEGTEVRLLHVIQYFPAPVEMEGVPTPPIGADRYEPLRWRAEENLNALSKKYFHGQQVISEAVLTLNSPASAICFYAREHGCELIVMATRGWSRLQGLLFGSTVQGVLNRATCPVMVVPAGEGEAER